jgi:hypothetical protein
MSELSPFTETAHPELKEQGGALVEVAMQREVAEIQAAMTIAKKFSRNQAQATDRILIACQRPTLAEGALYTYARGGSNITGPSIRLAEAIAQQWGNLQFGIRELEQRPGESTVEAYAWDLETNTRQVKIFQVKHVRHTKKGAYNLYDPRDIYELVANQGARRLRACILGVIPGDVVEAAVSQCESTLSAKADISPEAIQKMVGVFKEAGVTREMIEKRIQRKLDSITPAQVISLRKIYNSLKDGMSTPADWFDFEPDMLDMNGASQTEKIKEKLKRGKKADAPDPAGEAIPDSPDLSTGVNDSTPPQAITEAQLAELLKVPADLLADAWMETGIDQVDLKELDEQSGAAILEWVRRQ